MGRSPMTHSFSRFAGALVAAAVVGFAFMPGEASARMGGMGGFHGGGFHSGFAGFRSGSFNRGFPVRHFRTRFAFAAPFVYGAYAGYPYYYADDDGCLAPRRVWTSYGWRVRWVNVCY